MFTSAVASVFLLLTSSTAMPPPPALSDADNDLILPSSPRHPLQSDGDESLLLSSSPLHTHSILRPPFVPSPGERGPSNSLDQMYNKSPPPLQFFHAVPPHSEVQPHLGSESKAPNADFLSSFMDLVKPEHDPPRVMNNGGPSDPTMSLGETLKGLLESNMVPIPQMEPRSDPGTLTATMWAAMVALATFVIQRKIMFLTAFGAVIATIMLGISLGSSSLARQGKAADDRQDTLELMLSQEGIAGIISNIEGLWAKLLEVLASPADILSSGEQTVDVAQDRSDLNVTAVASQLNFSSKTTANVTSATSLALDDLPTSSPTPTIKQETLSESFSTATASPSVLSTSEASPPAVEPVALEREPDLSPGAAHQEALLQAPSSSGTNDANSSLLADKLNDVSSPIETSSETLSEDVTEETPSGNLVQENQEDAIIDTAGGQGLLNSTETEIITAPSNSSSSESP